MIGKVIIDYIGRYLIGIKIFVYIAKKNKPFYYFAHYHYF